MKYFGKLLLLSFCIFALHSLLGVHSIPTNSRLLLTHKERDRNYTVTNSLNTSLFQQSDNLTLGKDFIYYENDNGFVFKAIITDEGAAEPATLDDAITHVEFWLYKNKDDVPAQIQHNCTGECLEQSFVKDKLLLIAVHGFASEHSGLFGRSFLSAILEYNNDTDTNILLVNWSYLARLPNYRNAANNVEAVGNLIAVLVNNLLQQNLTTLEQTYFIGNGMGSDVANFVNSNLNGKKMAKIFALDPSYKIFGSQLRDDRRLDKTDAHFVLVIHAATGSFADGGHSFEDPIGHADFYRNGGKIQPGCSHEIWLRRGLCSHSMAFKYFIESINFENHFQACPCNSWENYERGNICICNDEKDFEPMGWHSNAKTWESRLYLRTNKNIPYGKPNMSNSVHPHLMAMLVTQILILFLIY